MGKVGILWLLAIGCWLMAGCKTMKVVEQVPVEVHDTMYRNVVQHDSTYVDRWHTIYQKGDTIFVRDSHMSVTYRTVTDTTYKYVEKPVTVTVEQIKEVEKPLRWWQKLFIGIGILGTVGLICVVMVWQWRKRH